MSLVDELREQIHILFPDYKDARNGDQVRVNCPLCAREGNIDTDHHMYFYLHKDQAPQFHCFKNPNHHGFVNERTLIDLAPANSHLINDGLMQRIGDSNKRIRFNSRYSLNKNMKYNLFINPVIDSSDYNEVKRQYVCNRIGVDLSFKDLFDNKIVLSIKDFLIYNHITSISRSEYVINLLDQYFVGFLSFDNSILIMRNLVYNKLQLPDCANERYIKYNIINSSSNTNGSYYIIPSICDVTKHIDIHIAEGTFDILSIFYNLKNADRSNNIYCAIGSNNYLNAIKYFMVIMGIIDATFYIYIDNDIKRYVLPDIKRKLSPLDFIKVFIVMNTKPGEKDMGVPKDRIVPYQYQLL